MRNVIHALVQIALVTAALLHASACSTTQTATKITNKAMAVQSAADVKELNALIAQGPLYFETDTDTLTDASQVLLQDIATQLHKMPRVSVVVAGNCDERGDTAYNLALGERRGQAALEYIVRLGVPKERVRIVSMGEESPASLGHSESAWAMNRRDEFTFRLPGEDRSVLNLAAEDSDGSALLASTSLGE